MTLKFKPQPTAINPNPQPVEASAQQLADIRLQLGIHLVDNTPDAEKPLSPVQQQAINAAVPQLVADAVAQLPSVGGIRDVPFSPRIPLRGSSVMPDTAVTGPIQFTPDLEGAVKGASCEVTLAASGITGQVPTLSGFLERTGSSPYINTPKEANSFFFEFDGRRAYCTRSTVIGGLKIEPGAGPGPTPNPTPLPNPTPTPIPTPTPTPGTNPTPEPTPGTGVVGSALPVVVGSSLNLIAEGNEVYRADTPGTGNGAMLALAQPLVGDGYIEVQYPATGDASTLLALYIAQPTSNAYNAGDYWGMVGTSGALGRGTKGSELTPLGKTLAAAFDARLRLQRFGSTVSLATSVDDGLTWTVQASWPTPATGPLWARFFTTFSGTARKIYRPRATWDTASAVPTPTPTPNPNPNPKPDPQPDPIPQPTPGTTGTPAVFASLHNLVLEAGNTYVATEAGGGNTAQGVVAGLLRADGFVQVQFLKAGDGGASNVLGLSLAPVGPLGYAANTVWAHLSAAGVVSWGVGNDNKLNATSYTLPAGPLSLVRLDRHGEAVTLETSVDGGQTWTARHQYASITAALSARLYTTFAGSARHLYEPTTSGFAA